MVSLSVYRIAIIALLLYAAISGTLLFVSQQRTTELNREIRSLSDEISNLRNEVGRLRSQVSNLTQPHPQVLAIDWRVKLVIHDSSRGLNITIPGNIGVAGGLWNDHALDSFGPPGYAPLGTRDASGTIYIQSTVPRVYTFGDFFDIWGQTLNDTCVLDYCADQNHPPPFMSDGNQERCLDRRVGLSNGKEWVIVIWSTVAVGQCPD